MTMPNFLIIGAAKAGTTSLYHYLGQHPEVYVSPVKEPKFFAIKDRKLEFVGPDGELLASPVSESRAGRNRPIFTLEEYQALFDGLTDEKAAGESSPAYLYVPRAARSIREHIPGVRLIAVLRDPAERAYSAFLHRVREGREPAADFARALREEEGRMRSGWGLGYHYRNRGFYYPQLKRYYETFERDQIQVYLHEDLRDDPVGTAQSAYRFLGVDDAFVPDTSTRYNTAGVPRNRLAGTLVTKFNKMAPALRRLPSGVLTRVKGRIFTKPPPLDPRVREELSGAYREDISKLQGLIGRDLSGWLAKGESAR